MLTIRVRDFTTTPGPGFKTEGPFSGEEFRERYLQPALLSWQKARCATPITVNMDGSEYGYSSAFLRESFGPLAQRYGTRFVQRAFRIVTEEEPGLEMEVWFCVENYWVN
jgi:hypothetical protein